MNDLLDALAAAWDLVLSGDPTLVGIVLLSLSISLTAVFLASILGLPLGAALAILRFPGRNAAVVLVNAFMGLPPIVAGLFVYLLLSRSGPLGSLGLLFTPTAVASFAAAFIACEGGLYLVSATIMGDTEDFTAAIAARILAINAGAFAGLLATSLLTAAAGRSHTGSLGRAATPIASR